MANQTLDGIEGNKAVDEMSLTVLAVNEVKTFTNFRGEGQMQNLRVADAAENECTFTLWNTDVNKLKCGDKFTLVKGWCKDYKGELQLSTGKIGKIVMDGEPMPAKEAPKAEAPKTGFKSKYAKKA
jgi:replication factor A1